MRSGNDPAHNIQGVCNIDLYELYSTRQNSRNAPGSVPRARMRAGMSAPGARASGAHAGERAARAPSGCSSRIAPGSEGIVPLETRRARDARAPFRFTQARCPQRLPWVRASGAHASEDMPPACRRARRPRSIQVHARETPALRSGSWVRAPPARISAAPALGARASGAHAGEDMPPAESSRIAPESTRIVPSETRRTRDARALSRLNITPRTHNS